jgi:hypothetical protein
MRSLGTVRSISCADHGGLFTGAKTQHRTHENEFKGGCDHYRCHDYEDANDH